jgi:hypothetical protein
VTRGGQRAVITEAGVPGMRGGEPRARLVDGREMPMGWNIGQAIPVGTTGMAEYIRASYASLWKFTPDDGEAMAA